MPGAPVWWFLNDAENIVLGRTEHLEIEHGTVEAAEAAAIARAGFRSIAGTPEAVPSGSVFTTTCAAGLPLGSSKAPEPSSRGERHRLCRRNAPVAAVREADAQRLRNGPGAPDWLLPETISTRKCRASRSAPRRCPDGPAALTPSASLSRRVRCQARSEQDFDRSASTRIRKDGTKLDGSASHRPHAATAIVAGDAENSCCLSSGLPCARGIRQPELRQSRIRWTELSVAGHDGQRVGACRHDESREGPHDSSRKSACAKAQTNLSLHGAFLRAEHDFDRRLPRFVGENRNA